MTLGEKIYNLRNERNMTQEQLAEKLGVTRQSVSKWEGNLVKPEIEKLKSMAQLFGISVDGLLSEEKNGSADKIPEIRRELKMYKNISLITGLLCIIMIVVTIVTAVNMSNRIKALELRDNRIIYSEPGDYSDDEDAFSELDWEIKVADHNSGFAVLHIKAVPKVYSDDTVITAAVEINNGESYTEELQNDDGEFIGDVTMPISGEQIKISLRIDNNGEKQNLVIAEDIYMLEDIVLLPDITIWATDVNGQKYKGTFSLGFDGEEDMNLVSDVAEPWIFIKYKDKIIYEFDDLSKNLLSYGEYSFDCKDADPDEFQMGITYKSKKLDKEIEICGKFDPTVNVDDGEFVISIDNGSYDDNYRIKVK